MAFPHRLRTLSLAMAATALLGISTSAPVAADAVADFYRGKQVAILLGTGPGRTYDIYARLLADHMARHIPGKPTMIVQYMQGGGGLKATNHMYNAAPKDGTMVATLFDTLPILQRLKPEAARYEADKFNWIGAFSQTVSVLIAMSDAPATTLEAAKKNEIIFGSIGKNNSTYWWPALINSVLGTKFKIVSGYRSGNEIYLAMERGEVHAYSPVWLSVTATKADWLRDGKIRVLTQLGNSPIDGLKDVPMGVDAATTAEGKQSLRFLAAASPLGRSVVAPPGVPAERIAALREALAKTVRDPAFLAEAEKRKLPVTPYTAAQLEEAVEAVLATPPALVERIRTALEG